MSHILLPRGADAAFDTLQLACFRWLRDNADAFIRKHPLKGFEVAEAAFELALQNKERVEGFVDVALLLRKMGGPSTLLLYLILPRIETLSAALRRCAETRAAAMRCGYEAARPCLVVPFTDPRLPDLQDVYLNVIGWDVTQPADPVEMLAP